MLALNVPARLFAVALSLGMAIVGGLLTVVSEQSARIIALTALIVVMLYNELWNIVLFRWHNTFAGFLGVLAFLGPLAFLQVTLVLVDHVSAWLVLVYVVWVIGYDIPWAYRLWRSICPANLIRKSQGRNWVNPVERSFCNARFSQWERSMTKLQQLLATFLSGSPWLIR